MYHRSFFGRFATGAARAMGHPLAFLLAVLIIVGWAVSGPFFGFSDTWQLVINTSTTIVTFLMVFLIQNTQNRDSEAVHLKLDELIRATKGAWNSLRLPAPPERPIANVSFTFGRPNVVKMFTRGVTMMSFVTYQSTSANHA